MYSDSNMVGIFMRVSGPAASFDRWKRGSLRNDLEANADPRTGGIAANGNPDNCSEDTRGCVHIVGTAVVWGRKMMER